VPQPTTLPHAPEPRSNLEKVENIDLLADSHNILNRWKNYFCQLLNVYRASDVGQIEIITAEPLFGVRKNCPISGRSLLLYQLIRRVMN
jgi:hypothetical protein